MPVYLKSRVVRCCFVPRPKANLSLSSDTIASIEQSGLLTAISNGTVDVIAAADNSGVIDTFLWTVIGNSMFFYEKGRIVSMKSLNQMIVYMITSRLTFVENKKMRNWKQ